MNEETEKMFQQISGKDQVSEGVKEVYNGVKKVADRADIGVSITLYPLIVYLGERLDGMKPQVKAAEVPESVEAGNFIDVDPYKGTGAEDE